MKYTRLQVAFVYVTLVYTSDLIQPVIIMSERWKLTVKGMTGHLIHVDIADPQAASVLDVKKEVHRQDSKLPPHLQRLVYQAGASRTKLEDGCRIASYAGLRSGATLLMVVLPPFEIYVQGVDGKMYTIVVPSSEPESYPLAELRVLVEAATRQRLDDYQFQSVQRKPLDENRHGRRLTLGHYNIKTGDTLFLMKIGFSLEITNPQVDLCFMVDCTGSMGKWIEAVKNNVRQLRDRLEADYKGCDICFAFVRYTDYDQPASTRNTWIDFTKSQPAFHGFVSAIVADGGGDAPEDIMGALKVVFTSLSWRSEGSKVLIHIADAPCHGTQYHDGGGDKYPSGDPAGISHESMMKEVVRFNIDYWFGYIQKSSTDKMIGIFNDSLRSLSDQRLMIRQFDAVQPSEVGEAVHKSVTASIFGSESSKKRNRKYTLNSTVPDWHSTAIIEQYGKKTPPPGPKSLHNLQEDLVLEGPSVQVCFKCAPHPFAEGAECLVFHAFDFTNRRQVVLKQFKAEGKEHNTLECYMKELEIRTIASAYATEFNSDKKKASNVCPIEFVPLDVIECAGGVRYLLETFIAGKIEKFSNNVGVVSSKSPHSEVMQAFSHFSWWKSGGTLVVCDLQGVMEGGRLLLTDPAIHSRGKQGWFGCTDLGYAGIQRFFKTHVCGGTCRQMGLETHTLSLGIHR